MMKIIERTRLWFTISLAIILIGMVFLVVNGMNFGIDFTGGTVVTIDIWKSFDKMDVETIAKKYADDSVARTVNETQVEVQSNKLDTAKTADLFKDVKDKYGLDDKALVSENQIGGAIGREMTNKAILALGAATLMMLLYIRVRFKDVKFGIAAIIALVHDVLITLGVYAIFKVPVNAPFIAAMLTIIGYSINDTIVIFDRIRENSKTFRGKTTSEVANISITQTMSRSINTVLTTLLTIVAVYFFVPSVRDFAFPIIIGILSGAYSSIFIASPIWVIFKNMKKKKKAMAA